MVSISLQHRITILIVLFSIILISAFIAIQLRNQLSVITLYNLDRSKLGGKAVK
ncbi:MAG: hypothetical protein HQ593_04205, partial [Candidatus Omnitrophica bacterium]|nr:hypothetical protein [Candidatus Omnitrophota bacterium]